jgi:hypothetical protein
MYSYRHPPLQYSPQRQLQLLELPHRRKMVELLIYLVLGDQSLGRSILVREIRSGLGGGNSLDSDSTSPITSSKKV